MTTSTVPGPLVLAAAHRTIRQLGPDEGPFAGRLVADGEHVRVLVDGQQLAGWIGWRYAAAEHVAVPVDLVRHEEGVSALLPWCTSTVTQFHARRINADEPVTAGEIVTLVVSLLRGVGELADATHEVTGEWWLAHDGRPLFVLGDGLGVTEAAALIIENLVDHSTDRALCRVLEQTLVDLSEPRRLSRSIDRREEELIGLAAPRALRQEVFAPARVESLRPDSRRRSRSFLEERSAGTQAAATAPAAARNERGLVSAVRGLREGLEERLDERRTARLHAGAPATPGTRHVSAATRRRSEDAAGTPRRIRPVVLGIAAATAVVIVGVLWPTQPERQASAGEGDWVSWVAPSTQAPDALPATPTPEADTSSTPAAPNSQDPLSAFPDLLESVFDCAEGDPAACDAALAADASGPIIERLTRGGAERTATLVDDYGDLAAVRLTATDTTDGLEQIVVIVKVEQKWRVRDVYDVADPPKE